MNQVPAARLHIKACGKRTFQSDRTVPVILKTNTAGDHVHIFKNTVAENCPKPGAGILQHNLQSFALTAIVIRCRHTGDPLFPFVNIVSHILQIHSRTSVCIDCLTAADPVITDSAAGIFKCSRIQRKIPVPSRLMRIA